MAGRQCVVCVTRLRAYWSCCRPAPSVVAFTPAGQIKASWDFATTGYQPQITLAQAAGIWLLEQASDPGRLEVHLVGIDGAKFRRPAVPGDQLRLEEERKGLVAANDRLRRWEHIFHQTEWAVATIHATRANNCWSTKGEGPCSITNEP